MIRKQHICRVVIILLASVTVARAQVPLESLLSNPGFEADATTPVDWTATLPNLQNYRLDAFQVNPSITPLGASAPLVAPDGANFVGVLNPGDENISGKLVHDPVAVDVPAGTTFTLTVWGVRGRLEGAGSPAFGRQPSRLSVTFTGWGPGSLPVVNPNTDDWSRTPAVKLVRSFTAWGPNGEWADELVTFTTSQPLAYLTVALTCINSVHASFCAADIEE